MEKFRFCDGNDRVTTNQQKSPGLLLLVTGDFVPRNGVELLTRGFSEGYRGWRKAALLLEVFVFTQVTREREEA